VQNTDGRTRPIALPKLRNPATPDGGLASSGAGWTGTGRSLATLRLAALRCRLNYFCSPAGRGDRCILTMRITSAIWYDTSSDEPCSYRGVHSIAQLNCNTQTRSASYTRCLFCVPEFPPVRSLRFLSRVSTRHYWAVWCRAVIWVLSGCSSVCPSPAGVVLKRLNPLPCISHTKDLHEIPMHSPLTGSLLQAVIY